MKSKRIFCASSRIDKHKANPALKSLLTRLQPFLLLMLLFGIDIRLKLGSSSKGKFSQITVAKVILFVYRLIIIFCWLISCIDTLDIFSYFSSVDLALSVSFLSIISIYFCSSITYIHLFYNQQSILMFLTDLICVIDKQFQENVNSDIVKKWANKLQKWSVAFFAFQITVCGLNFYIGIKFSFGIYNDVTEFRDAPHLLHEIGFEMPFVHLASILSVAFRFCFMMPFLQAALNTFCFLLIVAILHFESLESFAMNHGGCSQYFVKFLQEFMMKHRQACRLVNGINDNFSFLIFIWFSAQIFLIICLSKIVSFADVPMAGIISFALLTILLLGSFLLECLLISDINSKVIIFLKTFLYIFIYLDISCFGFIEIY